jgi:hypothetical protein
MESLLSARMRAFRIGVIVVFVLLAVPVGAQYLLPAEPIGPSAGEPGTERPSNVTVVTVDGTGPGQIAAYRPDGSVLYRNRSHTLYHDVDPSPAGRMTVMYVASDFGAPSSACDGPSCIRNVVERVNLTTGEVTRLHTVVEPDVGSSQTHDVDRVNDSVLLVGDIGPPDRVYMVNTTTDEIIWQWRVESAYQPDSGGQYPGDWTHLNDVAYLADGRVMVNLRNQDQVVFVRPGEGLQENWTLGCDGCHDVLYEHHNPDYIPASQGGPAIVVADSENNRFVEYQRRGGEWHRSWLWSDQRLQWPRDADRLPSGRTLLVNSHGDSLLAVNSTGEVTWQQPVPPGVYDAERLGTGDESAGGQSAAELGYSSYTGGMHPLTALVPNLVLHGALAALPNWVSPAGAAALLIGAVVGIAWLSVEGVVWIVRARRSRESGSEPG